MSRNPGLLADTYEALCSLERNLTLREELRQTIAALRAKVEVELELVRLKQSSTPPKF